MLASNKELNQLLERTLKTGALGLLAILIFISACDTSVSSSSDRFKGNTVIDGYQVSWNKVVSTSDPGSQTPLLFSFTPTEVGASGVTEANWITEAKQQNLSVARTKQLYNASHIYPSKDGGVASCTAFAIRQGFCNHIKRLSTAERVARARQGLMTSETCRWIGFDQAFDNYMKARAGAVATTLWVKAACD